ncbi:MAG TPA: hypothetical protein VF791_06525 [Pyrinomonadaceae bacterium]
MNEMKGTMTRRLVKFVLLPALVLSCAVIGLRHAQGQREARSNYVAKISKASGGGKASVPVRINDDALVLKNLKLGRMASSTVLKGDLVNKASRYLDEMTFEIKAYDLDGRLLKGVEPKTIFTIERLKAHASMPLNSGYGVWLQGIALDRIATIEISETGDETAALSALDVIPLASHLLAWKEYSEIEE